MSNYFLKFFKFFGAAVSDLYGPRRGRLFVWSIELAKDRNQKKNKTEMYISRVGGSNDKWENDKGMRIILSAEIVPKKLKPFSSSLSFIINDQ